MKFNKWTLGLAAVGAVSLTSAVTARAVENNLNAVSAALSGISISGNVDTSIEWSVDPSGDDYQLSPGASIPFRFPSKQDGFNLNVVELTFEKPLGEDQWASGFKAQLLFGPDAVTYNPSANGDGDQDFGIKQAYVNLRTPIGNGIEWKLGAFDTIIGYEVFESASNPNFTRSWGYWAEPSQHTGILGSYRVNDAFAFSVGVANTLTQGINERNTSGDGFENNWCKTWMGSITLTAPESWGSLAGSTLYSGAVYGFDSNSGEQDRLNYYLGAVVNTPVTGLTTGLAYDFVSFGDEDDSHLNIIGLYASYKATEKLSFHGRGEYVIWDDDDDDGCWWGLTGTIQYDLWANVVSRLELRYEVDDEFDGAGESECSLLLAANIVYKF